MNRKDLESRRAQLAAQLAEIDKQLAAPDPSRVDPALLWEGAVVEVRLHSRSEWRLRRFKHMSGNDAFYTCADDGGFGVCHWEHCRLPADIIQWRNHTGSAISPVDFSATVLCLCELHNGEFILGSGIDCFWSNIDRLDIKRYAVLRP